MAKVRTWIIVLLSIVGFITICLVVLAGVSTMWVMRHVSTQPSTSAEAVKTFEDERRRFKDQKPLISTEDFDNQNDVVRRIEALPTSSTPATEMAILVWNPDDNRTVRLSLPFWMLKLGKRKVDIGSGAFDIERMRIDPHQLERIGPMLIVDLQRPGGERVLVWTR